MSIVASKGRTQLSAEALFRVVRSGFDTSADHRGGEAEMSLTAALRSAFAMVSLKSPSLLACDKPRAEGHLHRIYGMERVPCDTLMREILDPVAPELVRPVFKRIFRQRQRGKALDALVCLESHSVVARDGTGSFSSQTLHCASCVHKGHRHGSITSDHQMLGAAIIHPEKRDVMPFRPAPMVPQEGTAQNDGARNAGKRLIAKRRQDHPHLKLIVTEDRLSSHAPPLETRHDDGWHSSLGVHEGDQAFLFQQVQAAEPDGRVTDDDRHDRAVGLMHRCRLVNDVPLNASPTDVRVNVIEDWESGPDQVPHVSWVTDVRVSQRTVLHLMRGGRARGNIEHATFNTLKNQGDNFEHHDGHGQHHLAVVCAMRMMLALLVDQTQQRCGALCQAVWSKLGRTRLRCERMSAWFSDDVLESMPHLLEALWYGCKKPTPILASDSSEACSRCLCDGVPSNQGISPSWWASCASLAR